MNLSAIEASLLEKFKIHREEQLEAISIMARRVSDIKNIPNLQVDLYVLRQTIAERRASMSIKLLEISKRKETSKYERIEFLIEKADVRYNASQIKQKVEGELYAYTSLIEVISVWIDYETESLKTVDSMIYGIKNRLDSQEYFSMGLK